MTVPTPPADPAPPTADPSTTPPTDPAAAAMATDAGKKALQELRDQNKTLAAEVKALRERDPVKAIAEALGVKPEPGPTGDQALAEQVKQMQQQMRDAELRAARLEAGAAKGLTPAQAARLQGSTREELDADADRLKELFPTSATPGTPAPDPTQGPRGGASALEAQLKAAQDKGDTKEAIRLKTLIATQRQSK